MKLKYLTFVIMLFLFVTVVYADCTISKARQYSFDGEKTDYFGVVKIDSNDYCVFTYTPLNTTFSELIILDKSDSRVQNLERLGEVIFSYKTAQYINENSGKIDNSLQKIYDGLVENYHIYNTEFKKIKSAIKNLIDTTSEFVSLKIKIYGSLEIDVIKAIKFFVLDNITDWDKVVDNYKSYKETVDQIEKSNEKKYISYDVEIKKFYVNTIAIQKVMTKIDSEVNTNLASEFNNLNFEDLAVKTNEKSLAEIPLIDKRIEGREQQAQNKNKELINSLNSLNSGISKALGTKLDTTSYKVKYCDFKSKEPDKNLINVEMFKDYIQSAESLIIELYKTDSQLNEQIKTAHSRFFLVAWFYKLLWRISPC